MSDRDDLLRVDSTGTVHPVGRVASQILRARAGEWRVLRAPNDVILLRPSSMDGPVLKLAGEMRTPGALCDVVALASQSGWRGELAVLSEQGQRSFYFDAGCVVGASTTVPEERIGETLYRFGVITREQLEAIVRSAESTGKRVGEAAIELEFVTAEELYPMMARQVEEVFYAAIHLTEGSFYFYDRFDEKVLLRRHNLNAGALLLEAARRMDEMKYFREKIPNDSFIPVPMVGPGKKAPDEVAEVFAQCDGKRSIADIGRRIGQLEFEITRSVFQLCNAGFVMMQAARPQGPEAIVEVFNPALAAIHAACDDAGKGADLREGLSRFATGGGVYDPLFMMAGPLDDGTFKPERVARNLAALAGDDPDAWLVQLLQEYVGFATFQAESLVPREVLSKLSIKVAELLKPLRQLETPPVSRSAE
jgi:Domain of unknown function (DUF4388)